MRLTILSMELLVLVAVACSSGGFSQQEADSLVATEVAIALTQEPEPTLDIAATVSAAVQTTQAMMPTQTPESIPPTPEPQSTATPAATALPTAIHRPRPTAVPSSSTTVAPTPGHPARISSCSSAVAARPAWPQPRHGRYHFFFFFSDWPIPDLLKREHAMM